MFEVRHSRLIGWHVVYCANGADYNIGSWLRSCFDSQAEAVAAADRYSKAFPNGRV